MWIFLFYDLRLCSVSVCYRHSTTMCHMQTRWVAFGIAGGALLEVWAGGVWVSELPFPFSGAINSFASLAGQVGSCSNAVVMLVLLLTRCGFGEWFSRFSGCTQSSPSPHWCQAMVDFYELGLWKWKLCSVHSYVPVGGNQRAAEKISVLPIPGAFFQGYELRVKYLLFVKM